MRKLDRIPQTLGDKLRALRRGQAVSLDMIESRTNIQKKYLIALERGQYDELPAPLYTRNFIRAYARELHADEGYFIELYEEECGRCDLVDPMRMPRQRVRRGRFFVLNNFFKFASVLSIASVIFIYLGFQIHAIIAPPNVVLFSPANEIVTENAEVLVEGLVEDESTVFVNGEQVVINADRTFQQSVDLHKGVNVIVIEAQRRYSRRYHEERTIIFDPGDLASMR